MDASCERRFLQAFVRELKAELDLEREVRMDLERRLHRFEPLLSVPSSISHPPYSITPATEGYSNNISSEQVLLLPASQHHHHENNQHNPLNAVHMDPNESHLSIRSTVATNNSASYFSRRSGSCGGGGTTQHTNDVIPLLSSKTLTPQSLWVWTQQQQQRLAEQDDQRSTSHNGASENSFSREVAQFLSELEVQSRLQLTAHEEDNFLLLGALFAALTPPSIATSSSAPQPISKRKPNNTIIVDATPTRKVLFATEDTNRREGGTQQQQRQSVHDTPTNAMPTVDLSCSNFSSPSHDFSKPPPMATAGKGTNNIHSSVAEVTRQYQSIVKVLIEREAAAVQERDTAMRALNQKQHHINNNKDPHIHSPYVQNTEARQNTSPDHTTSAATPNHQRQPNPQQLQSVETAAAVGSRSRSRSRGRSPEAQFLLQDVLQMTDEVLRGVA